MAWPIILANASAPLLGLADTAVIGRTGTAAELGAIALGALVFSFVYWGFGFLRMGTTGFTAQAAGAGDEAEVRATVARGLIFGLAIGMVLVALQGLIAYVAFELLSASPAVEAVARDYVAFRIWGAPAALGTYALMGLLIGLGKSRHLLVVQVGLNGLNIALDVLFAGGLGMGARGIGLGTAVAEWCAFAFALLVCVRILRARHADREPFWPIARLRDLARLRQTLGANADIMIRTLCLIFGFAWFTNQGAQFGDAILAANHILLQLVSFAAFFLDGYAFAAESLVGSAVGARRRSVFDAAVRRSTELAGLTALALAASFMLLGPTLIDLLTNLESVAETAKRFLPYAAAYVLCSFAAFQLDGIFIGATRTRDLRNASIASMLTFLAAWWLLADRFGNTGLWVAFIVFVIARAVALGARYPELRASLNTSAHLSSGA
jgi:multidrug resistance protein, MATE family